MSKIILDFGSGNTCKNDLSIMSKMINELKAVDTGKHRVIIKWQLFEEAGDNIPLDHEVFLEAYGYAERLGYKTTASVFDLNSLYYLLRNFTVPFVKIANNRQLDYLINEIPRGIPVYVSSDNPVHIFSTESAIRKIRMLSCISNYPASMDEYKENGLPLKTAVSDHTPDLRLFKRYTPDIYECHYKLPDSAGLDTGSFARTPEQLREVL